MKRSREGVFHGASTSLHSPYSTQNKSSFTKGLKGWPFWEESSSEEKLETKHDRDLAQNPYLSQTPPLLHLRLSCALRRQCRLTSVLIQLSKVKIWVLKRGHSHGKQVRFYHSTGFCSISLPSQLGALPRRRQDWEAVRDTFTGLVGIEVTDKTQQLAGSECPRSGQPPVFWEEAWPQQMALRWATCPRGVEGAGDGHNSPGDRVVTLYQRGEGWREMSLWDKVLNQPSTKDKMKAGIRMQASVRTQLWVRETRPRRGWSSLEEPNLT